VSESSPWEKPEQSALGAVGLLGAIAAFAVVAGIEAALVSSVLVVFWFLLPAIYVVGFGHVLLAAFLTTPTGFEVLLVELGFLLLLADAAFQHPFPSLLFSTSVLVAGVFVLLAALVLVTDGRLWLSAGVLLGAIGLVSLGVTWYGSFGTGVSEDV